MSLLDIIFHLANFIAPALALALALPVCDRFLLEKSPAAPVLYAQVAIIFVVGVVVLSAGLWLLGRDGMMATYTALVLCTASAQWLLSRRWRG